MQMSSLRRRVVVLASVSIGLLAVTPAGAASLQKVNQSDWWAGVSGLPSYVNMLASPKFLYRSELGPAGQPLDGYEIASKLSFWLLGTTPSDELLDTAAAGGLDAVDGVESAARAMLEQPGAVEVMTTAAAA